MLCKHHADKNAQFHCVSCKGCFCKECIEVRKFEEFTAYICKECGGKCVENNKSHSEEQNISSSKPGGIQIPDSDEKFGFWGNFVSIFTYPFNGTGRIMIAVGTIILSCLYLLLETSSIDSPAGICAVSGIVLFACYGLIYMVNVVAVSALAYGKVSLGWPAIRILRWTKIIFLFFVISIICYGPALAYLFIYPKVDTEFWIILGIGVYIYPMFILAVSLLENKKAVDIFFILSSIAKTFFAYNLLVIFWIFFHCAYYAIGFTPLTVIPIIGNLLQWFSVVYLLLVNMRLLGIFYRSYRKKLNWFSDVKPSKINKK